MISSSRTTTNRTKKTLITTSRLTLRRFTALLLASLLVLLAACGSKDNSASGASGAQAGDGGKKTPVKVVLDWSPNTNHTGLYAAQSLGYFAENGLDVQIVQPGAAGSEAMVASGEAAFGVGTQEGVTQSRIQGVPIVSIGAIIQHNTSGFASPAAKNIKTPKDFEGKTYGGWGSPNERAMLQSLMQKQQADINKVKIVNVGDADFFTAVKRDIDFEWIFYAWTGIEAELRNEPLNMIYLTDYSKQLDYYTPLLIASEKTIQQKPELVRSFMAAVSKGYQYAIDHPQESADLLVKAVPDLDPKLVKASQKWLSPKYKDDAPRWGEQKKEVWENYYNWMNDHKLLEGTTDVGKAFTNDFLPAK
ncbi:ABC transporter substrate-binding protein [Paenibacillus sp. J31TS4]|uniref:ABC transporter substrate-binding protein n=1 Tax=Paenibacillus sp. J31TS4 TaxID=2807195 RepID=UPI001B16373C|nr:ABC transporter substrate-binding protein [Paenibacillus sp. J31TS4]GIP41284.1 ABC transporter substrate-binding protein [Paenibacillus sp. J31TS4]